MEDRKTYQLTEDEAAKLALHHTRIKNFELQVENGKWKLHALESELEKQRSALSQIETAVQQRVVEEATKLDVAKKLVEARLGIDNLDLSKFELTEDHKLIETEDAPKEEAPE